MARSTRAPAAAYLLAALATPVWADTVTVTATKDTSMYSEDGALSNGKGRSMFSGATALDADVRRALMSYDIAAAVPAGATITSVSLDLSVTMTISADQEVSLHRLLSDWGESTSIGSGEQGGGGLAVSGDTTWTHSFYSTTTWPAQGGDFEPTPSATIPVGFIGHYQWSSPGMIADVQSWLDSPASNFGWLIKHDDEVSYASAKRFGTHEAPIVLDRPSLTIDYDMGGCAGTNYCAVNVNSTGSPASMSNSGSCSVATNQFTLAAGPVPNQPFLFFHAPNQIQAPFGNGFLCAGGGIVRINPPMFATGGVATRLLDLPATGITMPVTRNFQCWFRDPAGGGSFFNTSDGLEVLFTP